MKQRSQHGSVPSQLQQQLARLKDIGAKNTQVLPKQQQQWRPTTTFSKQSGLALFMKK